MGLHNINDGASPALPAGGNPWDLDYDAISDRLITDLAGDSAPVFEQFINNEFYSPVFESLDPTRVETRTGASAPSGFQFGIVNNFPIFGAFQDPAAGDITGGTIAIDLFATPGDAQNAFDTNRQAILDDPSDIERRFFNFTGVGQVMQLITPLDDFGVDFVRTVAQSLVGDALLTVALNGYAVPGSTSALPFSTFNDGPPPAQGAGDGGKFASAALLAVGDLAGSISIGLASPHRSLTLNGNFTFVGAQPEIDSAGVVRAYRGDVASVFAFDNTTGAFSIPFTGSVPFNNPSDFGPGDVIILNGSGGDLHQAPAAGSADIRIGGGGGFAGWIGDPVAPADFFGAQDCVSGAVGFNTQTGAFDLTFIRGIGAPGWNQMAAGQAFWVTSSCSGGFNLLLPGPGDLAGTLPSAADLGGALDVPLVAGATDAPDIFALVNSPSLLGSLARHYQQNEISAIQAAANNVSNIPAIQITSFQGDTLQWADETGIGQVMSGVDALFGGANFESRDSAVGEVLVGVRPNFDDSARTYHLVVGNGSRVQYARITEQGELPVAQLLLDDVIALMQSTLVRE